MNAVLTMVDVPMTVLTLTAATDAAVETDLLWPMTCIPVKVKIKHFYSSFFTLNSFLNNNKFSLLL